MKFLLRRLTFLRYVRFLTEIALGMFKAITKIGFAIYIAFVVLAFAYFGPEPYAGRLLSTSIFQNFLAPVFDPWIYSRDIINDTVAKAELISGRLENRDPSSIVFQRSRVHQPFSQNTFLKTDSTSNASIELLDGSQIQLAPDSMVLITMEKSSDSKDLVLSVEIQKGSLQAQKNKKTSSLTRNKKSAPIRVLVKTQDHKIIEVTEKKIQVQTQAPRSKVAPSTKVTQQSQVLAEAPLLIETETPPPQRLPSSIEFPFSKPFKKRLNTPQRPSFESSILQYQISSGSFLSKAKISSLKSDSSAAYRQAAKSLTLQNYHETQGFNSALRSALDMVLKSRKGPEYCKANLSMLNNLGEHFKGKNRNPASIGNMQNFEQWARNWKNEIARNCRGLK